jgi:hypothetical protein
MGVEMKKKRGEHEEVKKNKRAFLYKKHFARV